MYVKSFGADHHFNQYQHGQIVYDVIIVLVFVFMYIFCIETKGLTLEETAMYESISFITFNGSLTNPSLFDGLDAVETLEKKAGERLVIDGVNLKHHADSLDKTSITKYFDVVNV